MFVKPENPSNNMNIFKRTFRPPVSPWDHHHKRDKDPMGSCCSKLFLVVVFLVLVCFIFLKCVGKFRPIFGI